MIVGHIKRVKKEWNECMNVRETITEEKVVENLISLII